MRIAIATPASAGTTRGNRLTALRYARLLRSLGHTARVVERWTDGDHDVLIALHAVKSASSVDAFARAHPSRPIVLVLTGTDVYGELARDPRGARSLRLARRIVVLQPRALRELDAAARRKCSVVFQSVDPGRRARRARRGSFRAVALGHLRAVKDPFLLADALARLPASSQIRAVHAGEALDAEHGRRARELSRARSRWRWLGPRAHTAALELLRSGDAFVQTSIAEGGSLALAEAVALGLPVLVTRIPASVGMLGARHPGLFPAGDPAALARLLLRAEREPAFRRRLERESARLAPRFSPDEERARWCALLARL